MKSFGGAYAEYDATGRNGVEAAADIREKLEGLDVADKVVALRVRGELSGGKTTDIGFAELREGLMERGALFVYLNRHSLTSRDFLVTTQQGEDPATIENRTFEAGIANVKVGPEPLRAAGGVQTAKRLLQTLRQGAKGDESKKAYTERIVEDGETDLGLKETVP